MKPGTRILIVEDDRAIARLLELELEHRGMVVRLVAEGTVDDPRGEGAPRVRATPLEAARQLAARLAGVTDVRVADGALRIGGRVEPACLNRALVEPGIAVEELTREQASLESIFLELTETGEAHHAA